MYKATKCVRLGSKKGHTLEAFIFASSIKIEARCDRSAIGRRISTMSLHRIDGKRVDSVPSNLKRFMLGAKGAAVRCGLCFQDG